MKKQTTPTEIKPLKNVLDTEMEFHTFGALDGYTISNRGVIYDPDGNEVTPQLYRGKWVYGINGYMVYYDYAVAKIWKGHPKGMRLVHLDGDPTNNDVDNLEWQPRQVNNYTPMKQREPERPMGWIKRYTPDGILVREYKDVDQLAYELIKFGEAKETKTLFHFLRRSLQTGMYFLGCRWVLSSPEVLPDVVRTLHTERYEGSVEIEEPKTEGTWIRRYCGPWMVQEFSNIDEAVEYMMKHHKSPRKNLLERLRTHIRGEERGAKTIAGCKWIASGEDALVSQISQENWENAHKGNRRTALPTVKEEEETLKTVEPIKPMEEKKQTPRPRKTQEVKTQPIPTIEVDVVGFDSPKVKIERIDSLHVRVSVSV